MNEYGITTYIAFCKVCNKSVLMENRHQLIYYVSNSLEWHRNKQGLHCIECWNKKSWWDKFTEFIMEDLYGHEMR